eukprot:7335345-Karenia_brevis.AAC.1
MVPYEFERDTREKIRENVQYRLPGVTHNATQQEIVSAHTGAFLRTHPDNALARIYNEGLE